MRNPAIGIITTYEVNFFHGTGALILTYFKHFNAPKPIVWHTRNIYPPSSPTVRSRAVWGWGPRKSAPKLKKRIQKYLAQDRFARRLRSRRGLDFWMKLHGGAPRLIYVAPFDEISVELAIAAAENYGSKLFLHMLDDCAVHFHRVPEDRMKRLIELSDIRCAISPPMAQSYQEFSGYPFSALYMAIAEEEFPNLDDGTHATEDQPRLVMIGNFYGDTFPMVRDLLHESDDLHLTCYGPVRPGLKAQEDYINAGEGCIEHKGMIDPDNVSDLLKELVNYDIGIMPQGSLSLPEVGNFFRFSLPSRIATYLAAGLPVLVLGDRDSGAARFITDHQLGYVSSYEPDDFLRAIRHVSDRGWLQQTRRRCRSFCEKYLHLEDVIDPWLRQAFNAMADNMPIPEAPRLGSTG